MLSFNSNLLEHTVHWVFIQTVYEHDKVLFKQIELLCHSNFERFKRLLDEIFLIVLGCQGEDIDDDIPTRFDVGSFCSADVGDAHDDVLFNLCSRVQVVEHNFVERIQEIFLEIEASKLFFDQEFVSQLSQRINGK